MALRYVASTSTLESHHCTCAFSILRRAESNVFAALGVDDFKEVKKLIVDSILATDMTMHFQLKSDLDDLKTPDAVQTNNHLLAQALVHAADISNPTKPFDICKKWSDLLLEEFFAQGDRYALPCLSGPAYAAAALAHTFLLCLLLVFHSYHNREKREGLPVSPNMDRLTTDQASLSLNFCDFIVAPFFISIAAILPLSKAVVTALADNRAEWQRRRVKSSDPAEEQKWSRRDAAFLESIAQ